MVAREPADLPRANLIAEKHTTEVLKLYRVLK